jgi:hypothetical protein
MFRALSSDLLAEFVGTQKPDELRTKADGDDHRNDSRE